MDLTTLAIIIGAVIVLFIVFRILSGLLRLAISIAIIGLVGYWVYINFIVHSSSL